MFLELPFKVAFCWAAWTLFCLAMELLPAAGYESRNSSSSSSRKMPEEEFPSWAVVVVVVVVKASVVLPISVVENTLVVGTIAGVASDDIGAVSVVALQLDVVVAPSVVLHSLDTVAVPNIVPKRIRKNLTIILYICSCRSQRWTDTDTTSDMSSCPSPCPKQTRTRTQHFMEVRARTWTESWFRTRTRFWTRACRKTSDTDSDTDKLRTHVSAHLCLELSRMFDLNVDWDSLLDLVAP